jgi:hypothetical protein
MFEARLMVLQNDMVFNIVAEGLEAVPLTYDVYMKQLADTAQILSVPPEGVNETANERMWREQLQKEVTATPKRFAQWMKKREEERKKLNENQ